MLLHSEVGYLFEAIRAMYGKAPSGRQAEAAWAEALGNVDHGDLQRAWAAWKRTNEKAPTVAGLLRLIRDLPNRVGVGQAQERPMCAPCERDGGHRLRVGGTLHAPARAVVGPQDRLGPPEPMCSAHLETYARAEYLKRRHDADQQEADL